MKVSLFLARRLTLSSGNRKSSPALKVSIIAVALSIAVMLISIAVVLGFKREIREKLTGFNSHLTLYSTPTGSDEDNLITLHPSLTGILDNKPYITEYSLEISIPAIFKTNTDFKGVYLRSANSKHLSDFIRKNLEEGKVPDFNKKEDREKIVISRVAARELGLKTGDKIDTYFISNDVKVRRLEIAGIYNSHFDSYDKLIVFGSLPLVQTVTGLKENQGTSIRIETTDLQAVPERYMNLYDTLAEASADGRLFRNYNLDNVMNQGAAYFNWLSLLDTNVIVVLVLMTIVAIATLISGMLILILDKKRFIGIVRALGSPVKSVREVFIYLALKVAVYGMLLGNVFTLAFLYMQDRWHLIPLDAESYYIDFVPVELNLKYILLLNAAAIAIIYLSLLIPSRYVARISPAEAMRAEE